MADGLEVVRPRLLRPARCKVRLNHHGRLKRSEENSIIVTEIV